ncbi:MAG: ABC transporter permease [Clostridium sp.]|nr:ABC transporter permease [Clostridium sp.]
MVIRMIRLLKAERMKLKRSPVWLAFLILPIIPAVLGTLNYLGNLELLQSEWYSLWTQHTLFTSYLFLPIMIGVYCAYLMRLEHMNHNWNKVLTMPISRAMIFLSKMCMVSFMILFSEAWIGILFIVFGKLAGMTAQPPIKELVAWCLFGTLGGMVMAAVQLLCSMYIKSFALPVGIAFAGGLSGLLALAKGFGHIWPYSLMAYGMNSNGPQKMMESGYGMFVSVCAVYLIVFIMVGSRVMERRDV